MAFLDRFRLVVLDMHGTFMFRQDRFGPNEDFAATWARLGAPALAPAAVQGLLRALLGEAEWRYDDPAHLDDFPSMAELLAALPEAAALDAARRQAAEVVLAAHEIGRVPDDHAEALRRLAARHRLGLVSNLFSRPAPWLAHFDECALDGVFEHMLFSSETRSIKPSPRLFRRLLETAAVAPADAVYIGDDLARDVAGAQAAGMASVWLRHGRQRDPARDPVPDLEVDSLLELAPAD
jgi:HAD superfamily hydrolase (TIGR01509 family)